MSSFFIINNLTWVLVTGVYYMCNRQYSDHYLPTYSYMVRKNPAKLVHINMWLVGFLLRFSSILIRNQGKGLSIIFPLILLSWMGTTFYTVSDDQLEFNTVDKKHIISACIMFSLMFILNGFGHKWYGTS